MAQRKLDGRRWASREMIEFEVMIQPIKAFFGPWRGNGEPDRRKPRQAADAPSRS
jgi:hypothetical protein